MALSMMSSTSSSPHTRRYFHDCGRRHLTGLLFSAHAEVFPLQPLAILTGHDLLRTRGGISRFHPMKHAGRISSPHTRRYFYYGGCGRLIVRLFSARAEVFPGLMAWSRGSGPLLRTRGGISFGTTGILPRDFSSPHTRRYFPLKADFNTTTALFSAHAEVFPGSGIDISCQMTLLRTRGGISMQYKARRILADSSPHTRRYFRPAAT